MRFNNDQLSAVLGLALGAFTVQHALTYKIGTFASPQLGFFPLLAGGIILAFSLFGLVAATVRAQAGEGWKPLLSGIAWWRPLFSVVLLVLFAVGLDWLGFAITTWLFLLALFVGLERMPVLQAVGISLLIAGTSHLLFAILLQVQVPKGVLGF